VAAEEVRVVTLEIDPAISLHKVVVHQEVLQTQEDRFSVIIYKKI
jgi:hypothetical protein